MLRPRYPGRGTPAPPSKPAAPSPLLPELRKSGHVPELRPDAKSQVTVRYRDGRPEAIDTVVLSTQHAPEVEPAELEATVRESIIERFR